MRLDDQTKRQLLEVCRGIVEPSRIVASCLYGSHVYGYATKASDYDVLLIAKNYDDSVRFHKDRTDSREVRLLAVDQGLFELDADKGELGEFVVGRILTPYQTLLNEEYLKKLEVQAKKRVVTEELRNLVLQFGELSRGLVIRPEYFALVRVKKRARVFLPARYSFVEMLRPGLRETNVQLMTDGYVTALKELEKTGILALDGRNIELTQDFVDNLLARKIVERVVNVVESSQRALYSYLAHGMASYLNLDILTRELAQGLVTDPGTDWNPSRLIDPTRYLFLKAGTKLVKLDDRTSIEDFAIKLRPGAQVMVTPLGGVLNDVFLIVAGDEKLVAKRFTDWHGFKWFTLNLVMLGTKVFSLSGRARLSNEYGINQFLSEKGLNVPMMIHVSLQDRLLVEEYVPGSTMDMHVKSAIGKNTLSEGDRIIAFKAGQNLAEIHSKGVAVGDSKPENFLASEDGRIFTVDLEQAGKGGDEAWDVAEFLYYGGHYALTGLAKEGFYSFVSAFIEGYKSKGSHNVLKRASGLKYSKVFSIWTPAPVLLQITKQLKSASS